MIDKAIVYDIKLGKEYVDVNDIKQLIARCGRTYNRFEQGTSYIFAKKEDLDIVEEYFYGASTDINSKLNSFDELSFHAIPLIVKKKMNSVDDFQKWYERSFSFFQGIEIDYNVFESMMIENHLIDKEWNPCFVSILSARFYYPVSTIQKIDDKIKSNYHEITDQYILPWLLSCNDLGYCNSPHFNNFKNEVACKKLSFEHNELLEMYIYDCLLNNYRPAKLKRHINVILNDLGRFFGMFIELCKMNQVENLDYISDCKTKIMYNVNQDTLQFMKELDYYDKNFIIKLQGYNISNKNDLINKFYLIERSNDIDLITEIKSIKGALTENE